MRNLSMIAAVLLSACDGREPEIITCERFVNKVLAEPESYRFIDASMADLPAKISDFIKPELSDLEKLQLHEEEKIGLGIRLVHIAYEAENLTGKPITNNMTCAFKTVGGEISDNIEFDIESAASDHKFRIYMNDVRPDVQFKTKEYKCCL